MPTTGDAPDSAGVADDERVAMWFTPYPGYFEPPDALTSRNFKLRKEEAGLSVWRLDLITEQDLRERHSLPETTRF